MTNGIPEGTRVPDNPFFLSGLSSKITLGMLFLNWLLPFGRGLT